ncbi:MAG: response regulator with CheY-like receiver domain and winged-helix DNA-binding domain [Bacteroidetes bacterium]|nr:MAG: response regulator with CheY-like receiver domain and winged-helix DNA-binding domain [Bacteroidota bacterium]
MNRRILLVEDEENLRKTIKLNLEIEGYEVVTAVDGDSGVAQFRPGGYDLVILDVMLPKLNGFDVCAAIRKKDTDVPVLFLTAKASGEDKVHGLRLGADDYLTKPFNLEEFLLRVQNLIRRSKRIPESQLGTVYRFGENEVNFATFEAQCWDGKRWMLSKREVELLRLLIDKKGEVVSRDLILDLLWKEDAVPSARTIDNYILNFRKYFERNPRDPEFFYSIRGVGYKFKTGEAPGA